MEAIKYTPGHLQILDQLALPHETIFESVKTVQDGHAAIKTMKTRGAPAIAIVAALSLAVDASTRQAQGEFGDSASAALAFLESSLEYLKTSRPTAVNLFDAAAKLSAINQQAASVESATAASVVQLYVQAAEQMLVDDVQDNKNIGKHGADFIVNHVSNNKNISVLTHCNTG